MGQMVSVREGGQSILRIDNVIIKNSKNRAVHTAGLINWADDKDFLRHLIEFQRVYSVQFVGPKSQREKTFSEPKMDQNR